jgi:hypothetical protein
MRDRVFNSAGGCVAKRRDGWSVKRTRLAEAVAGVSRLMMMSSGGDRNEADGQELYAN